MNAAHPKYSAARAPGHEHIPLYPGGFMALRIVQLVLAVLLLALAAYGVYVYPLSSILLTLVVAIFTLFATVYYLVVRFSQPAGYSYWAILGLDIFLVIMWLSQFAALGADTSAYRAYYSTYSSSYSISFDSLGYALMAVGTGLGAIEFILHIVSLVIHSIRIHQHRAAGLHCKPGSAATLPTAMNSAPGGDEKSAYNNFAQQPYAMQQPTPAYQQQQGPFSAQPTAGSLQQQQQQQAPQQAYYQQGPPVPLFAQTTGGSTIPEQQPSPTPQQVAPQPTQSELGSIQYPPSPSELGNIQHPPAPQTTLPELGSIQYPPSPSELGNTQLQLPRQ